MNPNINARIKFLKALYLIPLAIALFASGVFLTQLPYQNENVVLFHLNTFGVTVHHIISLFIIGILIALYVVSQRNCLIAFDIKHSTVIQKK